MERHSGWHPGQHKSIKVSELLLPPRKIMTVHQPRHTASTVEDWQICLEFPEQHMQ